MKDLKLLMTFKNTMGNRFSITVYDPKEDLEEDQIMSAMDAIKEQNIFMPKGYDIAECLCAKVVDATVTEYDLEV